MNFIHGENRRGNRTIEYRAWEGMKARCDVRTRNASYRKRYVDRGIRVCDRWLSSFADFIKDMGRRPVGMTSIDRIDNDRSYEPGNCRWASREDQQRNLSSNVLLTVDGLTLPVAAWATRAGLSRSTVLRRYRAGLAPAECIASTDRRNIKEKKEANT